MGGSQTWCTSAMYTVVCGMKAWQQNWYFMKWLTVNIPRPLRSELCCWVSGVIWLNHYKWNSQVLETCKVRPTCVCVHVCVYTNYFRVSCVCNSSRILTYAIKDNFSLCRPVFGGRGFCGTKQEEREGKSLWMKYKRRARAREVQLIDIVKNGWKNTGEDFFCLVFF